VRATEYQELSPGQGGPKSWAFQTTGARAWARRPRVLALSAVPCAVEGGRNGRLSIARRYGEGGVDRFQRADRDILSRTRTP
jgi:hypothetical protein